MTGGFGKAEECCWPAAEGIGRVSKRLERVALSRDRSDHCHGRLKWAPTSCAFPDKEHAP